MKKFYFIISIILCCNMCVLASSNTTLDNIETSLFGVTYENENEIHRVDRIENSVYGNNSTGDITKRINRLKKDLSSDLMGQEIKPKEDTFAEDNDTWVEKEPVADTNIQYPAIDELEQILFNQTYQKQDIKVRLSNLEKKAFGKTFDDDLSTRVNRLKAQVRPQSFNNNAIAQSSNNFFDGSNGLKLDQNYHLDRYEPAGFDYDAYNNANKSSFFQPKKVSLNAVENNILRQSFPSDTTENRLARLEQAMFGTEFANESADERLERISVAYKAQRSSNKYDDNKFNRNMVTAMQIGTIILMVLACIL